MYRVFSPSANQRFISRFLVSIWMSGEDEGKKLLRRILPSGLLEFLKFAPLNEPQVENLDAIEIEIYLKYNSSYTEPDMVSSPLKSRLRERVASAMGFSHCNHVDIQNAQNLHANDFEPLKENFRIMFHAIVQDHHQPDLIWNEQTRIELREALEHELIELEREQRKHPSKKIAWNYHQFHVRYDSLKTEFRVASIYLQPFLDSTNNFIAELGNHHVLFEMFLRRVLVNIHRDIRLAVLCIRCLHKLYSACQSMMGSFDDMPLLVRMMDESEFVDVQHHLLELIYAMSTEEINLEQLLEREIINIFLKFAALSHLNPDQIGNMLARMTRTLLLEDAKHDELRANLEAHDTIDDEANTRGNSLSAWIPDDSECPSVWYIAPPNTALPPASQSARGPYKVNELRGMIDNNQIQRDWLVTPYSSEDSSDESYGSMVDTGLWRRLDEYFQVMIECKLRHLNLLVAAYPADSCRRTPAESINSCSKKFSHPRPHCGST